MELLLMMLLITFMVVGTTLVYLMRQIIFLTRENQRLKAENLELEQL